MENIIKSDLNLIANEAVDLASRVIAQGDELFPIGVSIDSDDEVNYCGVKASVDLPPAYVFYQRIIDGWRNEAKDSKLKAIAIASKIARDDESNAILIHCEHIDCMALDILIPFSYRQEGRVPEFHEQENAEGVFEVFQFCGDEEHA